MKLNALFAEAAEAAEGGYVGWVSEIPGVHAQGETLDETRNALIEALVLVVDANRNLADEYATGGNLIRESIETPM